MVDILLLKIAPLQWEDQTIYLTVSIGVASTLPKPDQDMKGFVKQDDAL